VRRTAATFLVVLASLLLFAAVLSAYARWALFDSDRFANRATAALEDSTVRTVVGDRVTDQLVVRSESDLLAARPIISSAVSGIVGSPAFRTLFRRAVLDVHRAVFARDQDTVTLTLADIGTVVGTALEKLRPQLARELEDSGRVVVVQRQVGTLAAGAARLADDVRVLAFVLAVLTVLAAAGAVALADDRRRAVSRLGLGAVVAGIAIVILYALARGIVLSRVDDPDVRAAVGDVWANFLADLRTLGWLLAGAGAVIAAAAASLIKPIDLEGPARAAWRIATTDPTRPWHRVARAGALLAIGVLVIAQPLAVLEIAATLFGILLVYEAVQSLLRMVYRPPEADEQVRRLGRVPRVMVPLLAVLVIGAGVAAVLAAGSTVTTVAATTTCNGSDALCDKPFDEVVLPATHNSMSVPLHGWFSSEQERPIAGQLEDGIRGLLLDTHYGDKLPNGNVRTDFNGRENLVGSLRQDQLSPESTAAALRLRERLGFRGEGVRGMYLCHTFCELGATRLDSVLRDIHQFLATHPGEIVVIVNQDYVTPEDFVGAIGDAGLTQYAFTPPAGPRWPTLREMIDSGKRLVLLAENEAGGAPWYQLAYSRLVEETPYTFPRTALLTDPAKLPVSCEPNRGPGSAPLFLINHWISTDPVPKPSDAAKVNAYEPLLARARECERVRDHLPNLLAVNFYKQGDVFRVVDTLNGIG
jgi:hypothetical protein